jgi:hypothetical protein
LLLLSLLSLHCGWAISQQSPPGEAYEATPEQLDAAFSAQDAAREAQAWSKVIIDRSRQDPLDSMAAQSDLVVRGIVSAQETVYDANDLPFTHTTITISEILKGDYPDSEIVLVQEGGPSRTDPESVVLVSDARHFNTGEEEMLFLELEPQHAAPERRIIVAQRFCIFDDKVYDENGRGLILSPVDNNAGYRLAWSNDRNPAPRFRQIHIGSHTLTKSFAEEQTSTDSGGATAPQARRAAPGFGSSVDVTTFTAAIKNQEGV